MPSPFPFLILLHSPPLFSLPLCLSLSFIFHLNCIWEFFAAFSSADNPFHNSSHVVFFPCCADAYIEDNLKPFPLPFFSCLFLLLQACPFLSSNVSIFLPPSLLILPPCLCFFVIFYLNCILQSFAVVLTPNIPFHHSSHVVFFSNSFLNFAGAYIEDNVLSLPLPFFSCPFLPLQGCPFLPCVVCISLPLPFSSLPSPLPFHFHYLLFELHLTNPCCIFNSRHSF